MVCLTGELVSGMTTTPSYIVVNACNRSQGRMQAVADLLLLASELRPVNTRNVTICQRSYSDCRDTVTARTKSLILLSEGLKRNLYDRTTGGWSIIAQNVNEICDVMVGVIECCAHGTYLNVVEMHHCQAIIPGIIDKYVICRCHAEIANVCNTIKTTRPEDLTQEVLLSMCEDVRKFLAVLTEVCHAASNNTYLEPSDQDQFKLCVKSFTSSASCFMSSIKTFKSQPSHALHRRCVSFANALVATTSATVDFATEDQFTGRPSVLTREGKETKRAILG